MSLLDRVFPRGMPTLQPARVVTGQKIYSETPGVIWERNLSSAGVPVNEYEALTVSAVFAACSRLGGIQGMLPIGVYEKSDKGRVEKHENPVSRLLNVAMNDEQTAFVGRFFMGFWKPLFGAACAEIGWDGAGRPAKIWPLGPWRVKPLYDEGGNLYYLVDGKRKIQPDDMIYIPHVTQDGICGEGFVHYAIESLGQVIAAERSAARFFENDMRPGGLLKHPGTPNKEARKTFRDEWAQNQGGLKNRGKVGVLWGGWEWIKESGMINPDQAQLLETRQFSVIEVARWLNVPPHWLAELGRSTWANIEYQGIETLQQILGPIFVGTEQEYDRKLLAPPRLYCKHSVNALLRGDMKARGEYYRLMREVGAYTANKVLELEDENGIGPEGDRRFVPVNWQPADDLMTGGKAQIKLKKTAPPVKPTTPLASGAPAGGAGAGAGGGAQPSKPSTKKPMAASVAGMMEHLLTMLSKKECNEANRAAKKPNEMMKWMDGFYGDFKGLMAANLRPLATLMLDSCGEHLDREQDWPVVWADCWAASATGDLLRAMDGPPEGWPNRVVDLLASWQNRPIQCALEWTKPILDKEMNDARN